MSGTSSGKSSPPSVMNISSSTFYNKISLYES
jgi:hypothetical protein